MRASAGDWKLSAVCQLLPEVFFFFFPQIRTLFLPKAAMSLRFIFFFLFKRNKTTQSSISFGVLLCPISLVVLEVPPDALSPPAFCVSPL